MHNGIFHPIQLRHLLSVLLYHFPFVIHETVLTIYRMREKKIFCIYGCFSASCCIKGGRNHIFRHNWIFRYMFTYENPLWQSSGITIFLCRYYIVIFDTLVSSFMDVLFLLLAVIFSELHEKPSFLCLFCCFVCLVPSGSQVPYLLYKWLLWRCVILTWVVFCVMTLWVNGRKCENLMRLGNSYLASLRTWYYFRLSFIFGCSGYDLTLIKNSQTLNSHYFLQKFLSNTKSFSNSLLVTAVSQITGKTTNSEKSWSINKLKSHVLFTWNDFM